MPLDRADREGKSISTMVVGNVYENEHENVYNSCCVQETVYMFPFFSRYHGCQKPDCKFRSKYLNKTVEERAKLAQKQHEKYDHFQNQIALLVEEHGYDPKNIHVMWECVWDEERKRPEIADFLLNHPIRDNVRLEAQRAVKAQLNDCYILKYPTDDSSLSPPPPSSSSLPPPPPTSVPPPTTTSSSPTPTPPPAEAHGQKRRLIAADMSSLYGFVALNTSFPVNKYIKLIGDEICSSSVHFTVDQFTYENKVFVGLLHVRVLPPRHLNCPFLLTKINGSSLAVLCRTCAQKRLQTPCQHTDAERSITDVWSSNEICFATSLNYKVTHYYEFLLYAETAPVLQKYTCLLAFHKIRSAALPSSVNPNSQEDLQRHCDRINREMNFLGIIGKRLKPNDLQPNAYFRKYFKNALVSWFGCFSVNLARRTVTKFLESKDHLIDYAARKKIVDICPINNRFVQLTVTGARPNAGSKFTCEEELRVSLTSCAAIGAVLTSKARIVIYQQMQMVQQHGAELLKVCCDSIFFSLPEQTMDPLQYSESFGYWKEVYPGPLLNICQIGVQNFAVLYKDRTSEQIVSEAKCSGMKMSHFTTGDLDYSTYSSAMKQLFNQALAPPPRTSLLGVQKWPNQRTYITPAGGQDTVRVVRKARSVFSSNILSRRVLDVNGYSFATKPYGYG
jgi:hypothetical protein